MKLFRHGPLGRERPGIVDREGYLRDLAGVIEDIGDEVSLGIDGSRVQRHRVARYDGGGG